MSGLGGPNMDKSDGGLAKFFNELDADGSGNISRKEMESTICRVYGKQLDSKIIDKMMSAADTDNDGEISLDEFKAIMLAGPEKTQVASLSAALGEVLTQRNIKLDQLARSWDLNADGAITLIEFRQSMRSKQLQLPKQFLEPTTQIDDLFEALDRDGSGALDANELKAALKSFGDEVKERKAIRSHSALSSALRTVSPLSVYLPEPLHCVRPCFRYAFTATGTQSCRVRRTQGVDALQTEMHAAAQGSGGDEALRGRRGAAACQEPTRGQQCGGHDLGGGAEEGCTGRAGGGDGGDSTGCGCGGRARGGGGRYEGDGGEQQGGRGEGGSGEGGSGEEDSRAQHARCGEAASAAGKGS